LPRNRASLLRWDKVAYQESTVIEFELFPISITVTPTVAVVHYRTRTATEDLKKNREQSTTRETDVFIKEAGQWRLIAIVGGDDAKR
jgi:ketosteroid isomerase-like protein